MPPENPTEPLAAKEVGEPPLMPANRVFFALEGAIRTSGVERGLEALFRLAAPPTVQEVRRARDVTIDRFAWSGEQGGS